jgi:hypothetical protein
MLVDNGSSGNDFLVLGVRRSKTIVLHSVVKPSYFVLFPWRGHTAYQTVVTTLGLHIELRGFSVDLSSRDELSVLGAAKNCSTRSLGMVGPGKHADTCKIGGRINQRGWQSCS